MIPGSYLPDFSTAGVYERERNHIGKENTVLTITFVMKWQIAHLTDGAPAGYISIV